MLRSTYFILAWTEKICFYFAVYDVAMKLNWKMDLKDEAPLVKEVQEDEHVEMLKVEEEEEVREMKAKWIS